MKTYLYSPSITVAIPQQNSQKKIFSFILALALSLAAFADGGSGGTKLTFKNPTLQSGIAGQDGAVYKFSKVTNNVDALVKINGRSDALVTLTSMDIPGTGWAGKAFQPQVSYNNGTTPDGVSDWWIEFQVTYVLEGTIIPVIVTEFDVTAIDVDGNAHLISENVSFYGLQKFIVDAGSILNGTTLTNALGLPIGRKFQGPVINFIGIDTTGTAVMATANFLLTNSFKMRAGGYSTGASGASDRMYSFAFEGFTFSSPLVFTLPVVMHSFNASLTNSKKVDLDWVTGNEKALSHFSIERSTNGRDYTESGIVFSDGTPSVKHSYSFSDVLKTSSKGVIYYRLKMVDNAGRYQYSAVKMVRIGEQVSTPTIVAFPNPVVNEVRVTIPTAWQKNQVIYEIYNLSGRMVKRTSSSNASQTEVISMQEFGAGSYMVKAYTPTEATTQIIVKK